MSFMLLFYLFFVGIFLAILSLVPQEKDRDFFAVISTYYVFILVFVVPVCTIGTGTYNWLKHGDWLHWAQRIPHIITVIHYFHPIPAADRERTPVPEHRMFELA